MKNFFLLLAFFFIGTILSAQDFTISGYVTNANGLAVNNIEVCVNTPTTSNNPFTGCVFTNSSGWYTINIPNGAVTGSNQNFYVSIVNCDSTLIVDTVSNNQGTINSVTVDFVYCQQITNCNAAFTTQSNGLHIDFIPASTSNLLHHFWDFGNGSTSTLSSPTHSYAAAGIYTIMHVAWNNFCADTVFQTILVDNTTDVFTYQINGLTVFFIQTNPNASATYTWTFGDGNTSSQYNPVHTYSTAGMYTVCLEVTMGGNTDTTCKTIIVPNNNHCYVSFTDSAVSTPANTVQFTGTSSHGIDTTQWYWDFGDGTTLSGQQNPVHTYADTGQYHVCVQIVQANNILCHYCNTIVVSNAINCQSSFTYTVLSSGAYVFTGDFTPLTTATDWTWNFGDGSSGTGQSIVHNYSTPGIYNVTLTVSSTNCPAVTTSQTVAVSGSSVICDASFTYHKSGATVHFFKSALNAIPSSTMSYHWDFGDGASSNMIYSSHTYTVPGTYTVCLTLSDSINNCYDQHCQTIVIGNNTTCQAAFTHIQGPANNVAFFGNFSPMSNCVQWEWDFGDSTTSNLQNPIHLFPGPGTYFVCLSVTTTTSNCPSATYCQPVIVHSNTSNCNAYFTYQVNNTNVHFYAISPSGTNTQYYLWDFGDGNTSSLSNPVHSYLNYGNYTVCLSIADSLFGCTDTFCLDVGIGSSGGFGGQVLAGGVGVDTGTVYLLNVVPTGNSNMGGIVPVASTSIDTGGYYLFQNISVGNYLVQAHLDPASSFILSHFPTYYGDVLYWTQASFINVAQNSMPGQYDINLISTTPLNNGNGQVSGLIVPGSGIKSNTDIDNVLVVLLDEFDTPLLYTYSDVNGHFAFNDLPYGTYKLFAEIWDKEPMPATIILDDSNSVVNNIIITVNEETVVTSVIYLDNVFIGHISELYPNPTKDIVYMDIDMQQNAKLSISVVNIFGQEVWNETIHTHVGANRLQLNAGNWADGLYYVRLTIENQHSTTKIITKIK